MPKPRSRRLTMEAAFCVEALQHAMARHQPAGKSLSGELRALIGVEDLRPALDGRGAQDTSSRALQDVVLASYRKRLSGTRLLIGSALAGIKASMPRRSSAP